MLRDSTHRYQHQFNNKSVKMTPQTTHHKLLMNLPTISYLTDIYFGVGIVRGLPEYLQHAGIHRPLVVTDAVLQELGLVDLLGIPSPVVFSDIPTNPREADVMAGLAVFRHEECDGIVALGGGSPIDCAKCVSLLATHPEPLEQYALIFNGAMHITPDKPPVIAVPTTAGTGSEVGRAALVTTAGGRKLGIISKHMIPTTAWCDPELTIGMPATLTAATGMDAISHCVETFCSPKFNPVADAIAIDGLSRAWTNLPVVVERPQDVDARAEMMIAALQGALAFQKGLGLVHSLSHPLGALDKRLHHGTLNAVFLPHVIRYNTPCCAEPIRRMGQAIGVGSAGVDVAAAMSDMNRQIGLPATLRDMGVIKEDLAGIAEAAVEDHSSATNPRPVTIEACQELLTTAF